MCWSLCLYVRTRVDTLQRTGGWVQSFSLRTCKRPVVALFSLSQVFCARWSCPSYSIARSECSLLLISTRFRLFSVCFLRSFRSFSSQMHLDAPTQGEASEPSPQNSPQSQIVVTMGPVRNYDISSREQLRHTQTVPIQAAKIMLVMCALLLAPLPGNAEYEFHTGKN